MCWQLQEGWPRYRASSAFRQCDCTCFLNTPPFLCWDFGALVLEALIWDYVNTGAAVITAVGEESPCFPAVVQRFLMIKGRGNYLCFFVAAFFSFFSLSADPDLRGILTISQQCVWSLSLYVAGGSWVLLWLCIHVCVCGVDAILLSVRSVIHLKN